MNPLSGQPLTTALAGLAAVLALSAIAKWLATRPATGSRGQRLEGLLTLIAAGIATGVAGTGMWRFFGDVLHIDNVYLRAALFAFLEIALLTEALRARRHLLDAIAARVDRPSTGLDGKAVWVFASMSGVLASLDARSLAEAVARLAAPLVAAWLWERGLASHRRAATGPRRISWRLTPERILVKFGLAEATGRAVADVDAARRVARLARTAFRFHSLPASSTRARQRAAARLRREVEKANEHLNLAGDPAMRDLVRAHLAVLYQVEEGTSSTAVGDLSAWAAGSDLTVRLGQPDTRPQLTGDSGQSDTEDTSSGQPADTGQRDTGDSDPPTRRTAARRPAGDRTVVNFATVAARHRTAGETELTVEQLADTLSAHHPDTTIGRPAALKTLRDVHGSCSTNRAHDAKNLHNARILAGRTRTESTG
jgi:hypothetical protein